MYIVEVTPFSKSIRNDSYSYFSPKKVDVGSVVTIPLRNKNTKGLVIGVKDGKKLKTEIRSSDFAMKKIKSVSKETFLNPKFVEAVSDVAEYFATSIGSILGSVVPKIIFNETDKFKNKKDKEGGAKDVVTKSQKYIIQSNDDDRYSEYKSIIREQFAKNKSTIFVVPTIEDCSVVEKKLSRGIEDSTFIFNSKLTKKKVLDTWKKIRAAKKPTLLISTPKFISLPISNIGMIIVERENSPAYRTHEMPYIDMRFLAEKYAEKLHVPFLCGDMMLRTETLKRYDDHVFFEYTPIKFRSITDAHQRMVDMNEEVIKEKDYPISNELKDLIEENIEENNHLFILNNRKGLAPLVVCEDCGHIVKCPDCDSPIVLYGKDANKKENYFNCNFCGHQRSAGEKCSNCTSWRLKTVGSGTDKIYKEVKKLFPETKVFILDKDNAKTPLQSQKVIKDFYDSPSAILVGTELALLYLYEPIENVAVSSIDSMFSSPDFRIRERILNILLKAKSKCQKNFLVQSKNIKSNIFKNLRDGNLTDFYRDEFVDRKKYDFPPFSLLIKICLSARDFNKSEKELENLKKDLGLEDLEIYESVVKRKAGVRTAVGLLRLDRDKWPNKDLIEKLKTLPAKFKIEVDAESLF